MEHLFFRSVIEAMTYKYFYYAYLNILAIWQPNPPWRGTAYTSNYPSSKLLTLSLPEIKDEDLICLQTNLRHI